MPGSASRALSQILQALQKCLVSGPKNSRRNPEGKPMSERFKTMRPGRGGWTEWVCPTPESYLMKCCDCGLVHEMQFSAFAEANQKRGNFEIIKLPWPIRAMFRVRRQRKPRNTK
jgi:hypothetical protein